MGIMRNENASKQVIDVTLPDVYSNVRFYFRPLTPTQYYNEGYKHPLLRYKEDKYANIPVPVFLLFNLSKLLSLPETRFSEVSQAGYGGELFSGVDAFSTLNFSFIYDNDWQHIKETKRYRHAEILHPSPFNINTCLDYILCRNELERLTLLNELRQNNAEAYSAYEKIIYVAKENVFFRNGFHIEQCAYHQKFIVITFADNVEVQKYIHKAMENNRLTSLPPVKLSVELDWFSHQKMMQQQFFSADVDLRQTKRCNIQIRSSVQSADTLCVKIYLDNKLMCHSQHELGDAGVLF